MARISNMNQLRSIKTVFAVLIILPATPLLAQGVDQETRALIEELALEESETAARDLPFGR